MTFAESDSPLSEEGEGSLKSLPLCLPHGLERGRCTIEGRGKKDRRKKTTERRTPSDVVEIPFACSKEKSIPLEGKEMTLDGPAL